VDNLAHTLVGAAIGRSIGGDKIPAAGWIGAVAANAPDWSEPLLFRLDRPSGAFYTLHRGITHSFIGAAVETVAITLAVWGIFALARRRAPPRALHPLLLLLLVFLAVASHLYMDWQGSYGVRPFLPWSGRWYYGDWVAIADPVYWLVPLVALAWGAERHWRDLTPIVLVAGIVLWLVFTADGVASWLRLTCVVLVEVGVLGWIRHWFGWGRRRHVAVLALVVLALYTAAQAVASVPVKAAAQRDAMRRFGTSAQWATLTEVGYPFTWTTVIASTDSVAGTTWTVPRHLEDPAVREALRVSPPARALQGFARFLAAEVDSSSHPARVTLRDVRYALPPSGGWAVVTVSLPASADAPSRR
jgi:inner membrane protein